MKKHTYTVPGGIKPTALMPLTRRMLPAVPGYMIRQAFKKRDVKMNGVRAASSEMAVAGAVVEVYLPDDDKARGIDVIYRDENVVAVFKPCGVSCREDEKGGATLPYLIDPHDPPLLCHRLDNPTDGVLLLAKNEAAQSEITLAFRQRRVKKRYECIVKGCPPKERDILSAYLKKDAQNARVAIYPRPVPGAVPIKTGYGVLSEGEASRLSVELFTGRTHQIRAHMAYIGSPILGDDLYGDREFNKRLGAKRLMLTATDLSLTLTGELKYLSGVNFHAEPGF